MNKIKVELTEDQVNYLGTLVVEKYQEINLHKDGGWNEKALAFNKRLQTTLAKAKS